MKKILAVLVLATMALGVFAQDLKKISIDWETSMRYTAIGNGLMDTAQTMHFSTLKGSGEMNPIMRPIFETHNQALIGLAGGVSIWGVDRLIQSLHDGKLRLAAYVIWSVVEYNFVEHNRKTFHGYGVPVFWVQFRF
jgi:hypothetical protein